jgi:hypothetical protein
LQRKLSDERLAIKGLYDQRRLNSAEASKRICFHDYVNILTVKVSVNQHGGTSEELHEQYKMMVLDFGSKLILEAKMDSHLGVRSCIVLLFRNAISHRVATSYKASNISNHVNNQACFETEISYHMRD